MQNDSVREWTLDDGSNRRFVGYVDYRSYAVGAPIVVMVVGDNVERSWYGSKRKWQMMVVSEIAFLVPPNSWRTASRLGIYSTTEYREGRVVFLAKESSDTGCRIDFIRGRTADDGSNPGFNR